MDPALEQANLDPPKPKSILARGLPVALLAHAALAVALTWGVNWKGPPDAEHAAIPLPPAVDTSTLAGVPDTARMGGPPTAGATAPQPPAAGPQPSQRNRDPRSAPAR